MKSPYYKHKQELRAAIESGKYRRIGQVGAALTMDMLLWGAGMLAVMGFVVYMKNSGWPGIQGWMEASNTTANMKKIGDIFAGANGYTGLNNAAVSANNNIFQTKFLPGGGVINNRWGGLVTVAFTTITVTADTMQYTNAGVPSAACATLANQLADDVDRVTIAGTVVKAVGAAVDPVALNNQCNSAASVTVLAEKIKQT